MDMTLKGEHFGQMPDTAGFNFYKRDHQLEFLMKRRFSQEEFEQASVLLTSLGESAGNELDSLSRVANKNPPILQPYNAKGERVDQIVFHPAYREMEKLGYSRFGLVAMSHKNDVLGWPGKFPYFLKYASWYLFAQAEFGLLCPMSMTDSAARVLEKFADDEMKNKYLPRLTSTNIDELWTGAQFMTEKQGGSDVGANTMKAVKKDDQWKLWGDKWFCSNPSADICLVLARPDENVPGTKGLGMFLVPRRVNGNQLNHYTINRLKDKLGTLSMASGEISFEGAVAYEVGKVENGFKQMMSMVNSSRLSNAVRSTGMIRRSFLESLEYARGRSSFGKDLANFPLMKETLFELLLDSETTTSVVLHTADVYFDAEEGSEESQSLLRILTPLLKGYICKRARYLTAEAMEARGGNGYIDDWINPQLVRDSHVGSIWEGTTNILAIDVLRSLGDADIRGIFFSSLLARFEKMNHPLTQRMAIIYSSICAKIQQQTNEVINSGGPKKELRAKQLMNRLYHIYAASLLLEEANFEIEESQNYRKLYLAAQYVLRYFIANGYSSLCFSDESLLDYFDDIVDWRKISEAVAEESLNVLERKSPI